MNTLSLVVGTLCLGTVILDIATNRINKLTFVNAALGIINLFMVIS